MTIRRLIIIVFLLFCSVLYAANQRTDLEPPYVFSETEFERAVELNETINTIYNDYNNLVPASKISGLSAGDMSYSDTRFNIGSFTRDISTASGTQVITGVGFEPKSIDIITLVDSVAGLASWGVVSGLTDRCMFDLNNSTANSYSWEGGSSITLLVGASDVYKGQVSAVSSDGFTVTWTKTGTPTGTAVILWRAFR